VSQKTSGRERRSQKRVRGEGVCAHGPAGRAVWEALMEERVAAVEERVERRVTVLGAVGEGVPALEGESNGSGKLEGWLRVDTILSVFGECASATDRTSARRVM
jgi:hypothetical protein